MSLTKVTYSMINGAVVNVKDFGAVGDGVTDDAAAINAAINSLAVTGGEVYLPPGTYLMSTTLALINNVYVRGAGIDVTSIKNTGTAVSPANITVTCFGTLTGSWVTGQTTSATTYAIDTPIETQPDIYCTTHANAANFAPSDYVLVTGPTHSTNFWYPNWIGQVQEIDAATGRVTLTEKMPFGGTSWTLIQKVLALPQNIKISDMTIYGTGNEAVQIQITKNVIVERVAIRAGSSGLSGATFAIAGTRNAIVRDCIGYGNYFEILACFASKIENNYLNSGSLVLDGGTQDSIVQNNIINSPTNAGAPTGGVYIVSESNRNIISNNVVINTPPTFAAISIEGAGVNKGNNVVSNNILTGADVSTTYGISINGSPYNTVVGNHLSSFYRGIHLVSSTENTVESTTFNNVTVPYDVDTASSIRSAFTSVTWPALTAASATPSVANGHVFTCYNGSAQNITNFSGGKSGQEITVYFGDANTTLVAGTLHLSGGVNYNPPNKTLMRFSLQGAEWYELSRTTTN